MRHFALDFENQPGERVGFALDVLEGVAVGVDDFQEVVEEGAGFEDVGVVFEADEALFLFVVFVVDVADDFFEDVFHGHDARRAAVFINDNRHVDFLDLELFEEVADFFCPGDEVGGAQERLPAEVFRFVEVCQEVFHVEDAFDVVQVLAEDGKAGVARLDDNLLHLTEMVFDVYRRDVDAGLDDVDGADVAEAHDAFQYLFLAVDFGIFGQFQCLGQLVDGDALLLGDAFADDGGGGDEQGGEGAENIGEQGEGSRHEDGYFEAGTVGVQLGHDFPDEEDDEGDQDDLYDEAQQGISREVEDDAHEVAGDDDDAYIDEVVGDQNRGEQQVRFLQQPDGFPVAAFLEGVDVAWGEGEVGDFRAGSERRTHQQE